MGGSAQEWFTTLDEDVVAGSSIGLRLVLTKFGPPDVDLAYEVRVERR